MSSTIDQRPVWILPTVVVGQVLVTSTWFAANAVASDIGLLWSHGPSIGQITLMVQLGFITGTLIVATTGLSDRLSGRQLFFISAMCAATSNVAILLAPANYLFVLMCRFATGVALAGVYPVGMRIAASWYASGLGRALGYLVGALVLGTGLTHLMRAFQIGANWHWVIIVATAAAIVGGGLVCLVPDGPHLKRLGGQPMQLSQLRQAWAEPKFRQATLAYFGHMWELYAFWAFMPRWMAVMEVSPATLALICFWVIAVGSLGCVIGGWLTERFSSRSVARFYLAVSAMCCLISPWMYDAQPVLWIAFMLVWGVAVVGDSPQLSSLNATAAPRHLVGTALTATTCVGFSITIASLLLLDYLSTLTEPRYTFWPLAIGPLIGFGALADRSSIASKL